MRLRIAAPIAAVLVLGVVSRASANPVVYDGGAASLPMRLWTGAAVILCLEVFGVAGVLWLRHCRFWRSFAALLVVNFALLAGFSHWLMIVDQAGPNVRAGTLIAEGAIVLIEAVCLYLISRYAWFATPRSRPLSQTGAFLVSFIANAISAALGLLFSSWAYDSLHSTLDMGGF